MDGFIELTQDKINGKEGINEINRMLKQIYDNLPGDGDTVRIFKGYGVPTLAASVGSLYQRLDGGANTTLYVKEATGTWTAK